jgi:hypothetical protein
MGEVKEVESARLGTYYPVDAELGGKGCIFFTHFLLRTDISMSGIKNLSGIF